MKFFFLIWALQHDIFVCSFSSKLLFIKKNNRAKHEMDQQYYDKMWLDEFSDVLNMISVTYLYDQMFTRFGRF